MIRPDVDNNTRINGPFLRPARYAMSAGDGPLSYAQNSSYQRGVVDVAKPIIEEEIATKLDLFKTSPNGSICVADFGCSTGHNSFPAMQIIIHAINQKKHESNYSKTPEFFVFFNDVISNDFNTLFNFVPPNSNYNAIAVPGDFHGRLMPKSSLHFAYSCWALHYLTQVPDNGNPTNWNKGQIYYSEDRKEVREAYLEQYSKDIGAFLEARAVEMVDGGLMTLLISAVPPLYISSDITLMGSCLMDMAKKGRFNESLVDSYNLPAYFPTQEELKAILERNHSFTTERFDIIENPGKYTRRGIDERATFLRAANESLLKDHFGSEIDLDEMFDIYKKKLEASPALQSPDDDEAFMILVVLKRKSSE